MRIGVDIDGVLADFNTAFIGLIKRVTGRDLFPDCYEPTTWHYPQALGYTNEEMHAVMSKRDNDRLFWYMLPEYPDTQETLNDLARRWRQSDDIYFITDRPGVESKVQTEAWLRQRLPNNMTPTVLLSSKKGTAAAALDLDVYIDDKWSNCLEVASLGRCRTMVRDRGWNRENDDPRITRVYTSVGFPDADQRIHQNS